MPRLARSTRRSAVPPESPPALPTRPASADQPLPYSDLMPGHWREYPDIETDSLWHIASRKREDGHRLAYHGNCVPQILTQLLTRFSRQGDTVLDLFLGMGTSAIEAANLGRTLVGVDIQAPLIDVVHETLAEQGKAAMARLVCGNSSDPEAMHAPLTEAIQSFQPSGQAQFLFLHPPYADIIRFSDLPGDLSGTDELDGFLDGFQRVAQLGWDLLAPGRFAGLVIGDKYHQGEWYPSASTAWTG